MKDSRWKRAHARTKRADCVASGYFSRTVHPTLTVHFRGSSKKIEGQTYCTYVHTEIPQTIVRLFIKAHIVLPLSIPIHNIEECSKTNHQFRSRHQIARRFEEDGG